MGVEGTKGQQDIVGSKENLRITVSNVLIHKPRAEIYYGQKKRGRGAVHGKQPHQAIYRKLLAGQVMADSPAPGIQLLW